MLRSCLDFVSILSRFSDKTRRDLEKSWSAVQLYVPGSNFLTHCDGYDKLKPFGFFIHAGMDGWSRKIYWLKLANTNKDPKIIAHYYLESILKYQKLSTLVRTDKGTENSEIESLHISLRTDHTDRFSGSNSFIKGKSTSNQRIESFWGQLRKHSMDHFIQFFKCMRDENVFNDADPVDVLCLRYCFGPLISYTLDLTRKEWNSHRIRKQNSKTTVPGKPNCLYYLPEKYGAKDCSKSLNKEAMEMLLKEFPKPVIYDPEFDDIVKELIPDVKISTTTDGALKLYVKIRELLKEY